MMDVNSGYIGHSMSRRAAEAYEDDEMPNSCLLYTSRCV